MKLEQTVSFALVGMLAICLGSLIGIAAPGDGQTGMIVFPLYTLGAVLGLVSIWSCGATKVPFAIWIIVLALAAIAIGSVAWCIFASIQYTQERTKRLKGATNVGGIAHDRAGRFLVIVGMLKDSRANSDTRNLAIANVARVAFESLPK